MEAFILINKEYYAFRLGYLFFENETEAALYYQEKQLNLLVKSYHTSLPKISSEKITEWLYHHYLKGYHVISAFIYLAKKQGFTYQIKEEPFFNLLQYIKANPTILNANNLALVHKLNNTFSLYSPQQLQVIANHINLCFDPRNYYPHKFFYPETFKLIDNFVPYFENKVIHNFLNLIHSTELYFKDFITHLKLAKLVYRCLTKQVGFDIKLEVEQSIERSSEIDSNFLSKKIAFLVSYLSDDEWVKFLAKIQQYPKVGGHYDKKIIIILSHLTDRLCLEDINQFWSAIFHYVNPCSRESEKLMVSFGSHLNYPTLDKLWPRLDENNYTQLSSHKQHVFNSQWLLYAPLLPPQEIKTVLDRLKVQLLPQTINTFFIILENFLPYLPSEEIKTNFYLVKEHFGKDLYCDYSIYFCLEKILPRLPYDEILPMTVQLSHHFQHLYLNEPQHWYLEKFCPVFQGYLNRLMRPDLQEIIETHVNSSIYALSFQGYSISDNNLLTGAHLLFLIANTEHYSLLINLREDLISGLKKLTKRDYFRFSIRSGEGGLTAINQLLTILNKIFPLLRPQMIRQIVPLIAKKCYFQCFLQQVNNELDDKVKAFDLATRPFLAFIMRLKPFLNQRRREQIVNYMHTYSGGIAFYQDEMASFLGSLSGFNSMSLKPFLEKYNWPHFYNKSSQEYEILGDIFIDFKNKINFYHFPSALKFFRSEIDKINQLYPLTDGSDLLIVQLHYKILELFDCFLTDLCQESFIEFKQSCFQLLEEYAHKLNSNNLFNCLNLFANNIKHFLGYPPSLTSNSFFNKSQHLIRQKLNEIASQWPEEQRRAKLH